MTRKDIFNKYQLNGKIYSYVAAHNDSLWKMISTSFADNISKQDMEALRMIVDGSFEKICNEQLNSDAVVERLVYLLWS